MKNTTVIVEVSGNVRFSEDITIVSKFLDPGERTMMSSDTWWRDFPPAYRSSFPLFGISDVSFSPLQF
jgi:hypothetical protein